MRSLRQSPTDPAFVQDPYVFYDRTRQHGPLFYWSEYSMVCANSHKAVSTLLRDRRFGREIPVEMAKPGPEHLSAFYQVEAHSMLELEAPKHTRLRKLVVRAFTSGRANALKPTIETVCHDLIDQFPTGQFDLLSAYGRLVPVLIICDLLGVDRQHAERLLGWSNDMVAMYQAKRDAYIETRAAKASEEFSDFLRALFEEKRGNPTKDLMSDLIAVREQGDQLSEEELVSTVILLLNAGHEATVHSLGNSIATLHANGIAEITPGIVEEALRFDPPLHMFTRWAYEDVELFGHTFKRGDQVGCLLAAANRDPEVYAHPNQFNHKRTDAPHTSFGAGIHFCVGAPLARLELHVALKILYDRCPNLKIVEPPEYADVYHFHGLRQLLVRL